MRIAMIAITTSSSMSVKPRRRDVVKYRDIAAPLSPDEPAALEPKSPDLGEPELWRVQLRDSLTLKDFAQGLQVPNLDRMIAASGDQAPAVGAERHAADLAQVTAEGADQLSSVAVPDFHGAILPGRRDPSSIAAERQGVDLTLVSSKGGLDFFAGLCVP